MINTTRQPTSPDLSSATPRVFVYPGNDKDDRIDVSADVIAFSASNGVDSPVGRFTISLLLRQGAEVFVGRMEASPSLLSVVRLNAIVTLGFDQPGGITMGRVVAISEGGSFEGSGASSRRFELQCETMGSLLTNDTIVLSALTGTGSETFRAQIRLALGDDNPMLIALPDTLGPLSPGGPDEAVNTFIGAGIAEVIRWAIDKVPSMQIPLMGSLYGDPKPGAWFRTDGSVTGWNDARIWTDDLKTYQGDMFGFIRSAVDHDFYEVFVDTVPYKPKFVNNSQTNSASDVPDVFLIVRPKPFDWSVAEVLPVTEETGLRWEDLRTRVDSLDAHVFELGDVITYQVGTSEREVYSWYQITSDCELIGNRASVALGLAYPAVDLYMVKRHGLRPYNARLALIGADIAAKASGDEQYTGEVINQITEFRNRLVNWHRFNRWMLNGSITVRGSDSYRPGDPVSLPWMSAALGDELGVRFYCTAVSWSWRVGSRYECTLTLTRGANETMITEARLMMAREANENPGLPREMMALA